MAVSLAKIEVGAGVLGVTYGVGYDGSGGAEIADVGACEGAELAPTREYKDIKIARSLAEVKSVYIGNGATFKIALLESSINNIVIGLGGDPGDVTTDATSEKYVFGGQKGLAVMHKLVYTVPQIDDATKDDIITVYRARVDGLSPVAFKTEEERKWEITFKAFGKSTGWELFEFVHKL